MLKDFYDAKKGTLMPSKYTFVKYKVGVANIL